MSVKHPPVTTFAPINVPEDLPDSAVMYVVFTHVRPFIARKISIGVLRQAMGGGGGGPQTLRILTDADGIDLTDLGYPGTLGFQLIETDFANGGGTVQIAGSSASKVVMFPPDIAPGSRVVIRYSDLFGSADNLLGIGLVQESGGDYVFDILNGNNEPIEGIPYGYSIEIVKTQLFGGQFRIWDAINGRQPNAGGGETPSTILSPNQNYSVSVTDNGVYASVLAGTAAYLVGQDVNDRLVRVALPSPGVSPLSIMRPVSDIANLPIGGEGEMRGSSGFTVSALIQFEDIPTGLEIICGNLNWAQPDGGWFIGVDATGWKFGAGRASDGTVVENFAGAAIPYGFLDIHWPLSLNRLFYVTLKVSGTTAYFYINARLSGTITLTGGYRPATATLYPMLFRNNNAGIPLNAVAARFCSLWYSQVIFADRYIRDEFTEVQKHGGPLGSFTYFTSLFYPSAGSGGVGFLPDRIGSLSPFVSLQSQPTSDLLPVW